MRGASAIIVCLVAACEPAASSPVTAPPKAASVSVEPVPPQTPTPRPHAVRERLRDGGDVYILHGGSDVATWSRRACLPAEVRVHKSESAPLQLAFDIQSRLGCDRSRVTIGLELQNDVLSTKNVSGRGTTAHACDQATKTNLREVDADEIVVDAVRIFASQASCERAKDRLGGRPLAKNESCFDREIASVFDQRVTTIPDGPFVARFEAMLAKGGVVWKPEADNGRGACVPFDVVRGTYAATDLERRTMSFSFVWKHDVRGIRHTTTHSFDYDRICRAASYGGVLGESVNAKGESEGHSAATSESPIPLAQVAGGVDALPLDHPSFFYSQAACVKHALTGAQAARP